MAKPFQTSDAKKLLESHRALQTKLKGVPALKATLREDVKSASAALLKSETKRLTDAISVDELAREKKGIRVKTLKDGGFSNVSDLNAASAAAIAALDGISDEGAAAIKNAASEITKKAEESAKIRLSADDRTREATSLVLALYRYGRAAAAEETAKELLSKYEKPILSAEETLSSAAGSLKWLFASKEKKKSAIEAYERLGALLEGEYGTAARESVKTLDGLKTVRENEAWSAFSSDPVAFFSALEEINPGALGNGDTRYGLPEELAAEIEKEPFFSNGLNCKLRRYQEWGVKYALHQKKILLGDEMGLGKTVQAIAAMVSLCNCGGRHFLVVCPASVLTNWCREITKMSTLEAVKIHGDHRDEALTQWLKRGGVGVTTFETTALFTLPEKFRFEMLVVDEAHYVKNPEARRSANVKKLGTHAERLLFMTGTALENKVDEMISLIRVLQPEVAKKAESMAYLSAAPKFREEIAPVYYRRRREDVLTELPELTESREWCTMTEAEEAVYEQAVLSKNYADARRVSWNVEDLKDSSKAARMKEIIDEAKAESRKVIVFSFFLDTVKKVCSLLGDSAMEPITGAVSPEHRQEIVDAFNAAPEGSVLVAQIQSGGTGLNIQAASVVILCEPQFKPSIENQAVSRAYRMGQARNVLVYRLLCDDTVDEKIVSLLENKQAVFDAFADKSAVAEESRELDQSTFGTVIEEEIERIKAKNAAAENAKISAVAASTAEAFEKVASASETASEKTPEAAPAVDSANAPEPASSKE